MIGFVFAVHPQKPGAVWVGSPGGIDVGERRHWSAAAESSKGLKRRHTAGRADLGLHPPIRFTPRLRLPGLAAPGHVDFMLATGRPSLTSPRPEFGQGG